jgi:DNA-binding NarL/FixJ family response regulator
MSPDTRTRTVLVVAQDSMQAARVEATLRDLTGWRIDVCAPRQLVGVLGDDPQTIIAIVVGDAEARRMLRAARSWPRPPAIIALGDDPRKLWTAAARARGLRAALPHWATPEELAGAVHAVHAGLLVLHREALLPSKTGDTAVAAETPLTPREREIVELLADGASNRVIAARLAISRHTVKFHVASILAKLGARGRTEAVALALRRGVLEV